MEPTISVMKIMAITPAEFEVEALASAYKSMLYIFNSPFFKIGKKMRLPKQTHENASFNSR